MSRGEPIVIGVTGASGFLGRALVRRLEEARHTVIPIPREIGRLPGTDALIHLAGESIAGLWTARKRAAIRESRVEGTRRLIDRLREARHRPRVLISASAVGYYGHRPGEALDEESGPGEGFRSEVCLAWEEEARAAEALGIRTAILRFGTILDPAGGFLGRMLPFLRWGLCFTLGRARDRLSWISREDGMRLIEFCLADPSIRGPVNATAPEAATQAAFARAAAAVAGRRVAGRVPRFALRLALGEFARAFIDSQDVRPTKALGHGFAFRYPDLETLFASWAREAFEARRHHVLA